MKRQLKSVVRAISMFGFSLATALVFSSVAQAEWYYGIGTGLSRTSIDGQQGFNTFAGPVKYDVSLDPGQFSDLMKSAFGFGGYATDGTWLVQYSLANIELEDEDSTVVGATTVTTKINFKMKGGEVTAGYLVQKSPAVMTYLDLGLRYTKHEFDNSVTATGAINGQASRSFSNDWTDAILGVTVNVPIAPPQWTWISRVNAGFGGSDSAFFVQTGVTWRFHKNWSTALNAKYLKVKFENGSQGQSDWYFYDAKEKSLGLSVLYNW